MDDQDIIILMTSIMLLIDMMHKVFIASYPMKSTCFGINNIISPQQTLESRYVILWTTLHEHWVMCGLDLLFDDLGPWVKPHNTNWFSRFSLIKFDGDC
jgi:hypothetical protein